MSDRWVILLVIFILALTIRLSALLVLPGRHTYGDEPMYMRVAQRICDDLAYPERRPGRPPGYATFIAAVWQLGPNTYTFLRLVQAGVGAATVILVFLVADQVFSETIAATAAVLMSLYPLWIYTGSLAFPQTIVCALLYLVCLTMLYGQEELNLRYGALVGILTGVTVLCAPTYVVLLPALLIWLIFIRRPRATGKSLRFWAVCLIGFAFVIGPWSVRNWIVSGEMIVISTNGPVNFWLGNNPSATLNTKSHLYEKYYAEHRDKLSRLSGPAKDRFFLEKAKQHISAHPLQTAVFTSAKFLAFFRPWPGDITSSRMSLEIFLLWAQGIVWTIMLVSGIVGFVLMRRDHPRIWLLMLVVISLACVHSLFFPAIRFRMPVDGIFGILAIAGLRRGFRGFKSWARCLSK